MDKGEKDSALGDSSSTGKALSDSQKGANSVEKVVDEDDLTLNPDEADKVTSQPPGISRSTDYDRMEDCKPIVVKERGGKKKAPRKGQKNEPIVLDDDAGDEVLATGSSAKRKKASAGAENDVKLPPRKKKAGTAAEEDTDGEGNGKLTSFFEVKDDA